MWIIIHPLFIKLFTPKNIGGITIFPFIILENKILKENKTFVNHEMIHLYQQAELFFIIFILWYYIEFLFLLLKHRNIYYAYKNISFEKEAYENESNYSYLLTRKWFSFIKYW